MAEAIPDPEMNEMCIMAYSTRTDSSNSRLSVPRRNDFIEVLWCIDDLLGLPGKWCPAEVLHVSASSEQNSLAIGVLLYLPSDNWDEQLHKVEFLVDRKLRVTDDYNSLVADRNDEAITSKNMNPKLDWRFYRASEKESLEDDQDWTPTSSLRNRNCGGGVEDRWVSADQTEITAIREGHSSLIVEMQKLKREVATLWKHIAGATSSQFIPNSPSGCGNVLPRLRHRIALKMQAPFQMQHLSRKRKFHDSENTVTASKVDGFHVGVIRVRVDCTLREFEYIAQLIRVEASADTVFFFPPFSYTQLPIQSSAVFRIMFTTFSKMLGHLGITSSGDKLEMARKCGSSSQGELLRMVCTYSFDEDDAKKPSQIFLGTSCGDGEIERNESEETEAAQLFPILSRASREWNKINQRFSHDLRAGGKRLPSLRESAPELQAFCLSWKRAPELGSRSWSRSLTQPAQVFGTI